MMHFLFFISLQKKHDYGKKYYLPKKIFKHLFFLDFIVEQLFHSFDDSNVLRIFVLEILFFVNEI